MPLGPCFFLLFFLSFFFYWFLLLLFFTLPDSCNTKLDGLSHQFITNTDTTEPITILPPTCKISYFTEDMEGAIHQALVWAPDPDACGRACNTSLISSRVAAESQSAAKRYQMSWVVRSLQHPQHQPKQRNFISRGSTELFTHSDFGWGMQGSEED